ncbi:MAG TPA: DegV family protein [Chloroflexi bacterium]|nr:DegV family protein [Chloroflexota bacterium]
MSRIAIVTDSTVCMPADLVRQYRITVLPQILVWGDETFRDGENIQPNDFYRRLATAKIMPKSSQVSMVDFKDAYERLLGEGYEILNILISSGLSGTIASALQAREAFPPDAPIEIVDSRTTGMEMGLHILQAARRIEQGATLVEAKAAAETAQEYSGLILTPMTLEFLHRGGRIGGASRFLGTALNIKPILHVDGGRVEPLERVRTRKRAKRRIVEVIAGRVGDKPVHVVALHANTAAEAAEILQMSKDKLNVVESFIADVSPVIGTHVGPGTLAMAYMVQH